MQPANDLAIYVPWASVFYGGDGRPGESRVVATGGDIQSIFLARALAERDLRVAHIVYPVGEANGPLPEKLTLVQVATLPSPRLRDKARRMVEAWRAFSEANARIYFFRGIGGDLIVGALFCAWHRRRLLFSAANDSDFDFARTDRSLIVRLLYRLAIRGAALIVAQRDDQAELARRMLPRTKTPIVIPSFAEDAATAQPAAEPEGFLWIARLVDYKQPLAFMRLARELPDVRFRMVAVTTNETSAELAARVTQEASLLPNLELMPLLPRDEALRLIRRATAVVATSWAEGMPNIFLEAWAAGVPVLSLHFDPDGAIEREGAGAAAGNSWERFREGARELAADRELRSEMGARGREFVRRRHDPEAVGGAWAELIRAALAEHHGGKAA